MRAPGDSSISSYTSSRADSRQSCEQRDPLSQGLLEVEVSVHGLLGDRGDLGGNAGPLSEQVDDLALDERGVDIHHDQAATVPEQADALHGHVDLLARRPPWPVPRRSRPMSAPDTWNSMAVTG